MPSPPKQQGPLLPPYLPVIALAACQSAGPLTAEMAEVSGAHYLYNTTAEENRLFLRLPMAHASRKNCTRCPRERGTVACPIPQAGMDMAKSESVRAAGGKKINPPTAATELIDMTDCAVGKRLAARISGESKHAPRASLV